MADSDDIARQVRRALAHAWALAAGEAVLALAAPVVLIGLVDGVLPAGDLELLMHLAILAATAGVALSIVRGARRRIMLRAAFWLRHVLAAGRPASDPAAAAAARIAGVVAGRRLATLVEAPFAVAFAALVVLVSPLLAAASIATAGSILLVAAAAARLTRPARRDGSADAGDHAGAAIDVTGRYLTASRRGTAVVVGEALMLLGLTAGAALATWLAVAGAISIGVAAAALLLSSCAAVAAVRTVAALPAVLDAAADWRELQRTAASGPATALTDEAVDADCCADAPPGPLPPPTRPAAAAMTLH